MVLPSGLIATLVTLPVCPSKTALTSPELASHTLVQSKEVTRCNSRRGKYNYHQGAQLT